eukprot:12857216-Ditylum_brightwellii.AAC.1
MLGTAGGSNERQPVVLPLKDCQEDWKKAAADKVLAATARIWMWRQQVRQRLRQQQTKTVKPSQSKRKQGAGNKEPAIYDLCGEILWRWSWSKFPMQV